MILHAVAYVEGKLPRPPYELEIAQKIESFGDPWGGGWMEWPAGLAAKVQTVRSYTQAFRAYRHNSANPKWVNANPQMFSLVSSVWDWRKKAGIIPWW